MITLTRHVRTLSVSALMLVLPGALSASSLILDNFTRTSSGETVVAPFTNPGTFTTGTYSGYVEVQVSGTGNSLIHLLNDAFHPVNNAFTPDSQYYQLNMGSTSAPLFHFVGEPRNIDNFIVFVQGVGFVTPPYVPAYSSANNHTYHFVVNTGLSTPEALQFGVSDGNFHDNGGAYLVNVWQLDRRTGNSVPDSPAPCIASCLALLLAGGLLVRMAPAAPRAARVTRS